MDDVYTRLANRAKQIESLVPEERERIIRMLPVEHQAYLRDALAKLAIERVRAAWHQAAEQWIIIHDEELYRYLCGQSETTYPSFTDYLAGEFGDLAGASRSHVYMLMAELRRYQSLPIPQEDWRSLGVGRINAIRPLIKQAVADGDMERVRDYLHTARTLPTDTEVRRFVAETQGRVLNEENLYLLAVAAEMRTFADALGGTDEPLRVLFEARDCVARAIARLGVGSLK